MTYDPRRPRPIFWNIPFGPVLFESTISNEIFEIMLEDAYKLKINNKNSYREHLAGNIEKEFFFEKDTQDKCTEELTFLATQYSAKLYEHNRLPSPWEKYIPENELTLDKIWVNFQNNGEWNPAHHHYGLFSFVVFLKIPAEIKQESNERHQKNKFPTAGKLEFDYGEDIPFVKFWHIVEPEEKKIYFFPSKLRHHVYPFKSKVERISVSGNFYTPRKNWQLY